MGKAMPTSLLERFEVEKVPSRNIHPKTGELIERMTYKVSVNVGCGRRKADLIGKKLNEFLKANVALFHG